MYDQVAKLVFFRYLKVAPRLFFGLFLETNVCIEREHHLTIVIIKITTDNRTITKSFAASLLNSNSKAKLEASTGKKMIQFDTLDDREDDEINEDQSDN